MTYRVINLHGEWNAKYRSIVVGKPDLICVHRTANPKATGESNNRWALRTGNASWHAMIEDDPSDGQPTVYEVVPSDQLAWHILETRKAQEMGRAITHPNVNKPRGDIQVYGIEVDEDLGPGGKPVWNQRTKDTLIAYLVDLILESQSEDHGRFARALTPDDIKGHSEFDPWTRELDPDGLWDPESIRTKVESQLIQTDEVIKNQSPQEMAEWTRLQEIADRLSRIETMIVTIERRVAALEQHGHGPPD